MEGIVALVDRIVAEEEGQGLIEYALIAALIAIAAVVVMRTVGGSINTKFGEVNTNLT